MSIPQDVKEITETLAALQLESVTTDENSSSVGFNRSLEKRQKSDSHSDSFQPMPIGGSYFFDPLMYLRINSSRPAIPAQPASPEKYIPTMDELIEFSRAKGTLIVNSSTHNKLESSKPPRTKHKQFSDPTPQPVIPKIPVFVFRFLQENKVKFVSMSLLKSYRAIAFSQGKNSSGQSPTADPWTEYIQVNHLRHYRLCHSFMFRVIDPLKPRRLVVIVPHMPKSLGCSIDLVHLSNTLGIVAEKMSLTAVEKEFGFPTFVCPPFGFEFAPKVHVKPESERAEILTVIAAELTVPATLDCVFDLGSVAMRIRPADLQTLASSKGWHVLENVVTIAGK